PTPLVRGKFPEDLRNLADLMRYVRNSIAHFNIEFTSSNNQTIDGIRIWNNRNEVENWSVFLQIEELKLLVNKFVDLSLSLNKADQKQEVP
ncbi:MAG: HEPN family nuclease, partial [Deinococcota bacterium]|nr:HEPN family nuclease [Deinococcota bacterium]